MASSGSANEDFQSRVAKIFGSLAFSRPSSSSSSSSKFSTTSAPAASRQLPGSVWTLSDTEVEKREWNRDSYDRDEIPCASSFDAILRQQRISPSTAEDDLKDIDGAEDFDDVWSIRASMGLDRTLDDEAEEDEYDKVALGTENDVEDLSLKDSLSKLSGGRTRDPRANYVAAKMRLKEDEMEANKLKACANQPSKSKESHVEESSKAVPPKPILKRKETSSDSEARTSKRVRFDSLLEETVKKPEDACSASTSSKSISHQSKTGARVPDYLLNPSKYTRYTFDPSCELIDKSPTGEYMDIPKAVEGSTDSESFKKVSFIPQKKTKDVREDSSNCSETKPIVAGELAEAEKPSATEDGVTEIGDLESSTSFQRNGRQYRAKQSVDETVV
ncbi:uncharacterized protein LOC17883213 [Capsella rubella]|nr:uncharacterized protein LOC17883213 [Capsella rubella]